MIDSFLPNRIILTATQQARRSARVARTWLSAVCLVAAVMAMILFQYRGTDALPVLGWTIVVAAIMTVFYRPRYGIYIIVSLGLLGDPSLMPWYPFDKNFSSLESLFYLGDALIISPLELFIGITYVAWIIRSGMRREFRFYASALVWPAAAFTFFLVVGLAYGLGRGGNVTIGLWEARPIFYLPAMLVLVNNLFDRREHFTNLMWAAMIGLVGEALVGAYTVIFIHDFDFGRFERLTQHSAAIHANTVFVFALAVWLYRASWSKRFILPLMAVAVTLSYVAAQRRASFLTLGVALILMTFFLYRERRRAFWSIVPPAAVIGVVYVLAFWNVQHPLGLPAQAVKSIIAQSQANAADQTSNVYRDLENINVSFTIHQEPLLGVGFGNKFYLLVSLPDISVFEWWEYITHNSIVWIWMKTGIGGFLAMLMLIGLAILTGIRVLFRLQDGNLQAIVATATLYIVMHFIYAYVDMSWDNQSMLYMGVMLGMISGAERVADRPAAARKKRWPWLNAPESSSALHGGAEESVP